MTGAGAGETAPKTLPSGAVAASTAKRGMASLVIGIVGCGVGGMLFLFCGGIVAAIAIPNFVRQSHISQSLSAKTNLERIWSAQRAWAARHDGEFLEFYVSPEDTSDANFARLGVDLGPLHHEYEGFYDGDVFVISASGDLDDDESFDEWELTSIDGIPVHIYDDVREISHYLDETEESTIAHDAAGELDGLGFPGGAPEPSRDVMAKSETARGNLLAIYEAQRSYKAARGKFLAFAGGNDLTWAALGMPGLPNETHHTYSARIVGDELTLTATGNLDSDAFLDEWTLSSKDGDPFQLKNDALNLDLSELAKALGGLGVIEATP